MFMAGSRLQLLVLLPLSDILDLEPSFHSKNRFVSKKKLCWFRNVWFVWDSGCYDMNYELFLHYNGEKMHSIFATGNLLCGN